MKGVVLAGGRGTRLQSLTRSVNKHLLPVYDKPLIHWPVMMLVRIGIGEIMIVSNPEDTERYRALFGDGGELGVSIVYGSQNEPNGIAGALAVAEEFTEGESVAVILGDNIFVDAVEIRDALEGFRSEGEEGALVFLKEVADPERFGIADVEGDTVRSIEEKPKTPQSNLAVTGLYFYDAHVFDIARTLTPSKRGELEITDVNNAYSAQGMMKFRRLGGAWIDAGTPESLFQANLVAAGMGYEAQPKIKILFGINKLAVGGAEHLVLHQLAHINRDRFNPHLVTLLQSTEPNLDAEAKKLGERWKKFSFRGFFDIASFWKLYRFLRRERFDVVITSLFFTSVLLRLAALLARVPVVIVSEVNVKSEEGRGALFLDRLLARFTEKIITNSKEGLEVVVRRLEVPREKCALIYSAIDLESSARRFSPEERALLRQTYRLTTEDVAIVTAGRLVEQKGQRYLIEAFANLRRAKPHLPLKLVIFGEGPLRDELTSQVAKLGVKDAVTFPGVAPLSRIVGITDIFALPSLWEGMSLMLLEAMAGEKSIVATDVSGSRELITEGENGFLVPPGNSAALAQKLAVLIEDKALRAKFARASVKEVQKFSIENNLNNLYAVIHQALRARRA